MAKTLVEDALMESFVIEGGQPLHGRVRAAGNKNGALPILAACMLTSDPVLLRNVPRIRDVDTMLALLGDLGVEVEWMGENEVRVHAAEIRKTELDAELCSRMRASFLLAGPLLVRCGSAIVAPAWSAARVPLAPFVSASRRRSGKMSRRSRTTWRP